MKKKIEKNWEYTLYENDGAFILSVICGSVALYTINVELNELEKNTFFELGNSFIEDFAEKIRQNPSFFKNRHRDLPSLQ
ncbi:hypothetical protein [Sediminicola luteus]|uniref:Uncharacterized protein n=1 Tax=Sediminicola luteus TaxID=319238 RepID=A0ABV2TXU4_9FLAO